MPNVNRGGATMSAVARVLPSGLRILEARTYPYSSWPQLSFSVFGAADDLQTAGIVTAEQLAALPKSGYKRFKAGNDEVSATTIVSRRKLGYRVHVVRHGAEHPDVAAYIKMLGLQPQVSEQPAARTTTPIPSNVVPIRPGMEWDWRERVRWAESRLQSNGNN